MNRVHVPVMPDEVLKLLAPVRKNAFMIDATLGEGGHSHLFLERHPNLRVEGIDIDSDMTKRATKYLAPDFGVRFKCREGWSDEILADWHGPAPDIVLLDLEISSYHYKESGLGFSFSSSEPLDMRLDPSDELQASDLVNTLNEVDLADLLYRYGEERYSRRIAKSLVEKRQKKRITMSSELANIVRSAVPSKARFGRLHPATRTFQALRIMINHELERLERLLDIVPPLLAPGGLFGVISFHSLEDRMVKQSFRKRDARYGGEFDILTKKPLAPTRDECSKNPPSRSAKFRVLQKPLQGSRQ